MYSLDSGGEQVQQDSRIEGRQDGWLALPTGQEAGSLSGLGFAGPQRGKENMNWASGEGDHVVGRAEYDFTATSDEEISFHAGDMLNLAPKENQPNIRGWLLGSLDGQSTGFVPANYIKILGKRRGRKAEEAEKRPEQQAFPNNPSLSTVSSGATLEDQEAALESVFVETSSTGHGVETSTSHRDTFDL